MKKYPPTYGKIFLFLIFFTHKFCQKLVFLKLLPIKLYLTIKKITF